MTDTEGHATHEIAATAKKNENENHIMELKVGKGEAVGRRKRRSLSCARSKKRITFPASGESLGGGSNKSPSLK